MLAIACGLAPTHDSSVSTPNQPSERPRLPKGGRQKFIPGAGMTSVQLFEEFASMAEGLGLGDLAKDVGIELGVDVGHGGQSTMAVRVALPTRVSFFMHTSALRSLLAGAFPCGATLRGLPGAPCAFCCPQETDGQGSYAGAASPTRVHMPHCSSSGPSIPAELAATLSAGGAQLCKRSGGLQAMPCHEPKRSDHSGWGWV